MRGYFEVLESVELGTEVEPKVAAYHAIWEHFRNGDSFNPTSLEASICRGFQIWAGYPEELAITICLDMNTVSVRPYEGSLEMGAYGLSVMFAEYVKIQLKDYFNYAHPIYVQACDKATSKKTSRKTTRKARA